MNYKIYTLRQEDRGILKATSDFVKKKGVELYIVGGYLRDIILKREKENPDIDFCLKRDAISFGRMLSKVIKAGFVVLDKEHGCCRLVKKIKDKLYTLDFTDFRGKNLEDDLLHRDFTINSFAVELGKAVNTESFSDLLIDPYGGIKDIKLKAIRIVCKGNFDEDPLRILRAFSLACIFNFTIEANTLKLIKIKKDKLSIISQERIRDELFKVLDSSDAFNYLRIMDELVILKLIMPEIEIMRGVKQGPYHHLDVLKHSLETVRQLEVIIQEYNRNNDVREYLNKVISGPRRRLALIKLGAFLHDIGKPQTMRRKNGKTIFHGHERQGAYITKIIAKRLKLSNDELDSLNKMVFWHLRPGYMADNENLSPRAKFRFARDTAGECISVLLLSLADQRATRGRLTSQESRLEHEKVVSGLIKEYFRKQKEKKLPRLINGDDVLRKFKLEPGPLIGKILSEVEELQAAGEVKNKAEALALAKSIISRRHAGEIRTGRKK